MFVHNQRTCVYDAFEASALRVFELQRARAERAEAEVRELRQHLHLLEDELSKHPAALAGESSTTDEAQSPTGERNRSHSDNLERRRRSSAANLFGRKDKVQPKPINNTGRLGPASRQLGRARTHAGFNMGN